MPQVSKSAGDRRRSWIMTSTMITVSPASRADQSRRKKSDPEDDCCDRHNDRPLSSDVQNWSGKVVGVVSFPDNAVARPVGLYPSSPKSTGSDRNRTNRTSEAAARNLLRRW